MRSDYERARDERYPDYREVLRESHRAVPAAPPLYRGRDAARLTELLRDHDDQRGAA